MFFKKFRIPPEVKKNTSVDTLSGRPDATNVRRRASGGQLRACIRPMRDGGRVCQVSAGVAPKYKISIPWVELLGALMAVRLAARHEDGDSDRVQRGPVFHAFIVCTLGMLRVDSASLLEFVGTLVSEIKLKTDPEKE
jgi:hypothetical protein